MKPASLEAGFLFYLGMNAKTQRHEEQKSDDSKLKRLSIERQTTSKKKLRDNCRNFSGRTNKSRSYGICNFYRRT